MPKPPHLCTCGNIVPYGERCACQIKRTRARNKRHDANRPSAARRGYNRAWRAARDAFLKLYPICRMCGAPATLVDHIKPHRGDERLFWDRSNWQPLCASCHNRHKQKQEQANGLQARKQSSGTDVVRVSRVSLTKPTRVTLCDKADQPIPVQTDRANEMVGLSILHVFAKSKDKVAPTRLIQFVSGFLFLELILLLEFLAEVSQSFADLHIHHIGRGQFGSERIQKALHLFTIWRLPTLEQRFDAADCVRRLSGKPYGAGGKADVFPDLANIHSAVPHVFSLVVSILLSFRPINCRVRSWELVA